MTILYFLSLVFFFQFNLNDYRKIILNEKEYYMKKSGGLMYQKINDSIVRIDNSYDNKLHHQSIDFIYEDEIYRLGGYGYFHFHNLLVKYNFEINEWENVNIEGSEDVDGFSFFDKGIQFLKDDKLFFFGIQTNEGKFYNKGYEIDLYEKKILNVLTLNQKLILPDYSKLYNENTLILFYKNDSKIIFYDIKNDLLKIKRLNKTISNSIQTKFKFEIIDDKIRFIRRNVEGNLVNMDLDIEFLINESKLSNENFFKRNSSPSYLWTLLLFIFPIIYFIYYSKKNEFFIKNDSFIYRSKVIISDKKQVQIIQMLFEKSPRNNYELNEIYINEGTNPIHVNRVKNHNISDINTKVKIQTGIEDFIRKEKSEIDKRMIVFYLNENFKNKFL